MQYGQIVFLLFIVLLFYYAALIVLDILKAKAVQAAELESQSEEDIDISDEAKTFKPFRISRDEPKQKENETEGQMNSDSNEQKIRKIMFSLIKKNSLNPTPKKHSNVPVIVTLL